MKKYTIILCSIITVVVTNVTAQKLIPFQYQSQSKWDYTSKWGFMNENRKIIKEPFNLNIAPKVIDRPYFYYGYKIIETKTWKAIWDSVETKGLKEIKGNIVSFHNPIRGTYQSYNFKNIATKKLIAAEGEFSSVNNYVIFEEAVKDGYGNKKGLKDDNGKIIIPAVYDKIENNGYNFFVAKNEKGYYIFNKAGKLVNTEPYADIKTNYGGNSEKVLIVALKEIKRDKSAQEYILLSPQGIELPLRIYSKKGANPFPNSRYRYLLRKKFFNKNNEEDDFYTNELCTPESKVSDDVIINEKGEIVFNKSGYSRFQFLSEYLIIANFTDNKKYLVNTKGVRAADFNIEQDDVIVISSDNNFLKYTNNKLINNNKLIFYDYDNKLGKAKKVKEVLLEDSIQIEEVSTAYDKYYVVKVKDFKKQQYASYIYDNTSKLILKSEDGLWMIKNEMLIKYTLNIKKEEMYIGYYDIDLKPYSIIKE